MQRHTVLYEADMAARLQHAYLVVFAPAERSWDVKPLSPNTIVLSSPLTRKPAASPLLQLQGWYTKAVHTAA